MKTDLEAIEARLNAATPGPWSYDDGVTDDTTLPRVRGKPQAVYDRHANWICSPESASWDGADADGEFIAHAPTDIAALLAEIRLLRSTGAAWLKAEERVRTEWGIGRGKAGLTEARLAFRAAVEGEK